jgi:ankyrin repeat protein
MRPRSLPTRTLPARPDLDQLKRQAKELRDAFVANRPDAVEEVQAHYRDADRSTFALHDAQLVLARAYGFDSWPKLRAFVDGVTIRRLRDAVVADDLAAVRAMLQVRPELGSASLDNLQILHHAVLNRSEAMVRLLMEHGASACEGIYPHRDATSALTIARERGDAAIVAAIEEEELRQRETKSGVAQAPAPDPLFKVIGTGDDAAAVALLDAKPALITTRHPVMGVTPLHFAAHRLRPTVVKYLLDRGADPSARDVRDHTPLDGAAFQSAADTAERFSSIAQLLLARGAALTAPAAVVMGDSEWLRARHAEGSLTNPIDDVGGLLRIAVTHNHADVLALLLDWDSIRMSASAFSTVTSTPSRGGCRSGIAWAATSTSWRRCS